MSSDTHAASLPAEGGVLIVDDDPVSRDTLAFILRSADFPVSTAADGLEAVEFVHAHPSAPPRIVFTDVHMPRMDGLELLAWLNTEAPTTATVIVTGNQERDLISASLRGGATEFLDKPFDLRGVLRAAHRALEAHRQRMHQRAAECRLRDVLDINRRLARSALDPAAHPAVRAAFTSRFHACTEAGGDFAVATTPGPDRVLLVLGDISGHGLKEGFLSAYFQGVLEGMSQHAASPREVAGSLNRFLRQRWHDRSPLSINTSLSVCFLELHLAERRALLLNCGGPGPTLVDAAGTPRFFPSGGAPLGWFDEVEAAETEIVLPAAGQVLLWSDGLEAQAAHLGLPPLALAQAILLDRNESPDSPLLARADDDLVASRFEWSPPGADDDFWNPLHAVTLPGDAGREIDQLHASWERVLGSCLPAAGALVRDISLCVREAVINGFLHGCRGSAERRVHLSLLLDRPGRRLRARVADDGDGFDPENPPAPADPEHLSLGLRLIRSLAASVRHSRDGRTVDMTFDLPSTDP